MSRNMKGFAPIVTQEMIDAGIRAAHRERSMVFWAFLGMIRDGIAGLTGLYRPRKSIADHLGLAGNT